MTNDPTVDEDRSSRRMRLHGLPHGHKLMWPGATIGQGLAVVPSQLHDAGMGLFATMDFMKGDVITIYEGEHIYKEEACKREVKTHMASICSRLVIDGIKRPENGIGGGSFVNDPRNRMMRNAEFKTAREGYKRKYGVYLVATRHITSGQEIYASYGNRGFALAMPVEYNPGVGNSSPLFSESPTTGLGNSSHV